MTAADNIHKYFFIFFPEKIRLDISKNPLLEFTWKIKPYFLQKIKVKKLKCHLLQFLFGTLRVNLSLFTIFAPRALDGTLSGKNLFP